MLYCLKQNKGAEIVAKVIGVSLSACVLSIATGRVKMEDVLAIYTSTDPGQWIKTTIPLYLTTYWIDSPEAAKIAKKLIEDGKLISTRTMQPPWEIVTGNNPVWVTSEDDLEKYKIPLTEKPAWWKKFVPFS